MGAREFFRRHLRWDIGGDRGADGPPQGSQGNPDQPRLSGDTSWAPGDLAECIVSGQWWQIVGPGVFIPAHGPEMSDVHKVIGVEPGIDVRTGQHVLFLKFSAWPRPYVATAFPQDRPCRRQGRARRSRFCRESAPHRAQTGFGCPWERAPMISELASDLRRTYSALVRAADNAAPCPTNPALADMLGFASPAMATERIRKLERLGLIAVERGSCSRVVTIIATGKRTAGTVPAPHWRERERDPLTGRCPSPQRKPVRRSPGKAAAASAFAPLERSADLSARIDADQRAQRGRREAWLALEQQKYGLPRRGRLIEEMAA